MGRPAGVDGSASPPYSPGAVESMMASARSSLVGVNAALRGAYDTVLASHPAPTETTSHSPTPIDRSPDAQPTSMMIQISIAREMHLRNGQYHSLRSGEGTMMIHNDIVPIVITDLELGEGTFLVSPAGSLAKHQFVRRQLVEPDSGGGGLIEVTLPGKSAMGATSPVTDACHPTTMAGDTTIPPFPGIVTDAPDSDATSVAPFPGAPGTVPGNSPSAAPFPGS